MRLHGKGARHASDIRERGAELVEVVLGIALFLVVMGGIGTQIVAPAVDQAHTIGGSTGTVLDRAHEFGKGIQGQVRPSETKPSKPSGSTDKPGAGDEGDDPQAPATDQAVYVNVTYDYADGVTAERSARYAYGESVTPEQPSRHGYYFKSWVSSATGRAYAAGKAIAMKENTTLTAVWEKHGWGKWVVDEEPGCTSTGLEHRTCPEEGCGDIETREIAAAGHTWTSQPAAELTCVTEGHTAYELCSVCSEKRGYASSGAAAGDTGHNYIAVAGKPAACTQVGWRKHKECTYCGKKLNYTELPALGHDSTKATCLAPAVCKRCGEETSPQLPHNYVAYTGYSPTCTSAGRTSGTYCTNGCGYNSSVEIAALGHQWRYTGSSGSYYVGGYVTTYAYCGRSSCSSDCGTTWCGESCSCPITSTYWDSEKYGPYTDDYYTCDRCGASKTV